MMIDAVEMARQLIGIPSVNPMGQEVNGEEFYEYALTDFLEQTFQQLGAATERQQIAPLRENIVARLDGTTAPEAGGQLLVFEVHQDTVPVQGMTIAPWEPTVDGDRLLGRGACDVKGGMAAMLAAFARLAHERPAGMSTVVMACTVNEEYGFTGARQLVDRWARNQSSLMPRLPDAVMVAEPTSLNVVVAHKGVVRWRCHTQGRAVHSSAPENGDNAIYRMAPVLLGLERFAHQLHHARPHPLLGSPTISVGTIAGGVSVNVVPDHCSIEIDRRLLPDEDPAAARQQLMGWLESQRPELPATVHDPPFLASEGLDNEHSKAQANHLSQIAQQHGCSANLIGVPYATDAPAFASRQVPTVVFGPGSIRQAHTADEWVSISQLRTAADVYFDVACSQLP